MYMTGQTRARALWEIVFRRHVLAVVVAIVLAVPPATAAQSLELPGESKPAPGSGIFVYSWNYAIGQDPISNPDKYASELVEALGTPGVDGLTLVVGWPD